MIHITAGKYVRLCDKLIGDRTLSGFGACFSIVRVSRAAAAAVALVLLLRTSSAAAKLKVVHRAQEPIWALPAWSLKLSTEALPKMGVGTG